MITLVPEGHWAIREYFGQFQKVLNPGAHFWFPFIGSVKKLYCWDKTAVKKNFLIEKSEQQTQILLRHCQTKDHISLNVKASINWKIIDPKAAVYQVDNLPQKVNQTAMNSLHFIMTTLNFSEVFSQQSVLCEKVSQDLNPIFSNWGVEVCRVQLQEIIYSKAVENALLSWIEADQKRKAMIALAEGESQALITKAKAQAQYDQIASENKAKELAIQAQADKDYIRALKDEVHSDQAAQLLMLRSKN